MNIQDHPCSPEASILVVQRGARHRYSIPRMFQEAGMLAALYTDSSVHSPIGRMASRLKDGGMGFSRLGALATRVPEGIPPEKVYSCDNLRVPNFNGDLSGKYKRQGLRGANVVYSMCGEEFKFLQWAKKQGLKLIVDVFVHPATERLVDAEAVRYRGKSQQSQAWIEDIENHFCSSFELADIILCPSRWVAEGVREFSPGSVDKIRVVPYGSSLEICPSINENPEAGRILFAGRDPLRKGLHYLAEAASRLRAQDINLDVRVAGVSHNELDWMKHRDELNCLGNVPMDRMHTEFSQADVFVLPSLAEGQAGVVLEAMAHGCPVIATRESGVDFNEGCGITVPSHDASALSDAIARVLGDRALRNNLARGALAQAADFSFDAWKARLVQVATETVLL